MNPIPVIIFVCAIALFAAYKARQHRQREIAANEMAWATLKQLAKTHFAERTKQHDGEIQTLKEAFTEGYHANQGGKEVKVQVTDLRQQNQALAEDLQGLFQQLLQVEKEASPEEVLLVVLHLAFSEGGLRMMEAQGRKRTAKQQQQLLRQRRQQLQLKADSLNA
ncbi:hypothetical protein [uncultured Ferrimonas sp.]|uniref:hypothetical protein n=1 Tax=uncultured Ferrimonas sp. TaxID=432640 RepID=UPI00262C8F4B|nr:hypothetical protein [uncultured Ferrimonas sp.]